LPGACGHPVVYVKQKGIDLGVEGPEIRGFRFLSDLKFSAAMKIDPKFESAISALRELKEI